MKFKKLPEICRMINCDEPTLRPHHHHLNGTGHLSRLICTCRNSQFEGFEGTRAKGA